MYKIYKKNKIYKNIFLVVVETYLKYSHKFICEHLLVSIELILKNKKL